MQINFHRLKLKIVQLWDLSDDAESFAIQVGKKLTAFKLLIKVVSERRVLEKKKVCLYQKYYDSE